MRWFREHWPSALGGFFLLWQGTKALIQWASTFDFLFERFHSPSWVGVVLKFLIDPPPLFTLLLVLIGLALIYWDVRFRHSRSPILPAALSAWVAHLRSASRAVEKPATGLTLTATGTAKTPRPLTAYEVERKLRILDERIVPLLDDMRLMINSGERLGSAGWNSFRNASASAEYKQSLMSYRDKFQTYGRELNSVRDEVGEYEDIRATLAFPQHGACLEGINRYLTRYGYVDTYLLREANGEALSNLLQSECDAFSKAVLDFTHWLNDARARVKHLLRNVSA